MIPRRVNGQKGGGGGQGFRALVPLDVALHTCAEPGLSMYIMHHSPPPPKGSRFRRTQMLLHRYMSAASIVDWLVLIIPGSSSFPRKGSSVCCVFGCARIFLPALLLRWTYRRMCMFTYFPDHGQCICPLSMPGKHWVAQTPRYMYGLGIQA